MKYRLIGEIDIRTGFATTDIIAHTEVVEAPEGSSVEDVVEISLSSFEEEQNPSWCEGYPLVLPEPEQSGARIAGEAELRSKVLLEALPCLKVNQEAPLTSDFIEYVTGVVATALNGKGVRATTREVGAFLADAGYPTLKP